jgi:hypothetical protein
MHSEGGSVETPGGVRSSGGATGGKAIRTRSSVETGKKRGPQGRAAKQGRKRKAGLVIKGN